MQNVEEILAIRHSALGHFGWEVFRKLRICSRLRPQVDHRQLVVQRNADKLDFINPQKFFLFDEDLFQEVLIEHVLGRQV